MIVGVKHCSVLDVKVDIVVNAANNHLVAGGGVCEAIFEKAGYEDLAKACQECGYVDTGDVAVTEGFGTGAKYILHAVGPIIDMHPDYHTLLEKLYHNILTTADSLQAESIAIPCISTGIFGCPLDECTDIALRVTKNYKSTHIKTCILCCYTQLEYDTYLKIHDLQSSDISLKSFLCLEDDIVRVITQSKCKYITYKNGGFSVDGVINNALDDKNTDKYLKIIKYSKHLSKSNPYKYLEWRIVFKSFKECEDFLVTQINKSKSNCICFACSKLNLMQPDNRFEPIDMDDTMWSKYMAVSVASDLFYTLTENMHRYVTLKSIYDSVGLYNISQDCIAFYIEHINDFFSKSLYSDNITLIALRYYIDEQSSKLKPTTNVPSISIYEIRVDTPHLTYTDISALERKRSGPILYHIKSNDSTSKYILSYKSNTDATPTIYETSWIPALPRENLSDNITTLEDLYHLMLDKLEDYLIQ